MTESEFRTFEAVGALVVVLDAEGRLVYWNRHCTELTGYALEEVRGRRLWDFLLLPDEVEQVKAEFERLPTSEHARPYANYWVTKTGERRWLAFSNTVTREPDGRVQYLVKTGIDRSASKQASDALRAAEATHGARALEVEQLYENARRVTEDLREANQHMVSATIQAQEVTEQLEAALSRAQESERELRAIAELRERFIGIVSHDLRNPLATISLWSEALLARGHLDEQDRQGVSRIVSNTKQMTRMILHLLDFTRARLGGGFPLETTPTDLRDVCRHVVEGIGGRFHLDIDGDVTGIWDPDRLMEALANIAGNAAEHAAPGTGFTIRARPEGADVVVEISNQGDPISPELLPIIFDPFRSGTREKPSAGHLGLGLYIAKQIVLASGGTLDARSDDGTTTFTMRLPRWQGAPASRSAPPADRPPEAGHPG